MLSPTAFTVFSATQIAMGEADITERQGVYAALFPKGRELLLGWGYCADELRFLGTLRGMDCLYLGRTTRRGLKERVTKHVVGDGRTSTLRRTLGVLLKRELSLKPVSKPGSYAFHYGEGEERLTDWICDNVWFACRERPEPKVSERRLIRVLNPPLNIVQRERHPFAQVLLRLRAAETDRWDV
jgi:hypothetical protein